MEEPPEHAIFILATTEAHKVPPTIMSRCQRYDFKKIPVEKIKESLEKITKAEEIKIDRGNPLPDREGIRGKHEGFAEPA